MSGNPMMTPLFSFIFCRNALFLSYKIKPGVQWERDDEEGGAALPAERDPEG